MNDQDLQIARQAATLRLQVEEKIRAAIASGRFKPGQRLVERELCALINVGRTSVREALRQLEAEGLIVTIPHRGPVVSSVSLEEARQLYDLRALLEGFAGREFAARGSDADIARLKAAVDRLKTAASSDEPGELIKAKTAFYQVLMEGCGNAFVQQTLRTLHNRITLLRTTSMTQEGRLPKSMREIRAIYDRIAARDPEGAEEACIKHIREAAKVALAVLERQSNT
jgi:DNA-binding GntR family transcriptional regulator